VECIRRFFRRRFNYESAVYPRFSKAVAEEENQEGFRLDVVVAASGFSGKEMKTLDEVGSDHQYLEIDTNLSRSVTVYGV
jgi:RIO kinase 2